jgi:hypothetical protein
VQDYERNQEILSGVDGAESEKMYPFEYCWEQSQQKPDVDRTPSKPIPGRVRTLLRLADHLICVIMFFISI